MRENITVEITQDEAARQRAIINRLRNKIGNKGLTYFITTLGCQMNTHDSEKIKGILEEIGYTESQEEEQADFIIYNTCAVRENAEQKVYGRLGSLKNIKIKKQSKPAHRPMWLHDAAGYGYFEA